jgi:hypothetical protein
MIVFAVFVGVIVRGGRRSSSDRVSPRPAVKIAGASRGATGMAPARPSPDRPKLGLRRWPHVVVLVGPPAGSEPSIALDRPPGWGIVVDGVAGGALGDLELGEVVEVDELHEPSMDYDAAHHHPEGNVAVLTEVGLILGH